MPKNLETTETTKESFSVRPSPNSRKTAIKSATNPDGVGVAFPKKGHSESK